VQLLAIRLLEASNEMLAAKVNVVLDEYKNFIRFPLGYFWLMQFSRIINDKKRAVWKLTIEIK